MNIPLAKMAGYQSLGEALIVQTLSTAHICLAKDYERKTERYKESSASLAQIEKGNIHYIIDYFDLNLDGDILIINFFNLAAKDNGQRRNFGIKENVSSNIIK